MRPLCRAAVVALGVAACAAASDIGGIEFFGYGDLDRAAIRESLPLREGSPWLEENREALRNSVKDQVGTDPADMAVTCCDESGNRWIYIGLGREVGPGIRFLDAPHGPYASPKSCSCSTKGSRRPWSPPWSAAEKPFAKTFPEGTP